MFGMVMAMGIANLPSKSTYLVGLVSGTAGLDGDQMGADEAELVMLAWAVVDSRQAKVAIT